MNSRDIDKKIKIVIGANDFLVGGMQKQLVRQFRHFDFDKFEFYLFILKDFPERRNLLHEIDKRVEIHTLNFKSVRDIRSWRSLSSTLKIIKPDILMSSLFFGNFVFRVLGLIYKYKVISREHNTYKDKSLIQKTIDKFLAFCTFKIVAVSEEVANFTSKQEKIKRDKFVVIRNGIDLDEIENFINTHDKERTRELFGFYPEEKLILNVGRLHTQKNQSALIRGFEKFSRDNPEYRLVLVGEGVIEDELKKEAEEVGLKKISFTGATDNTFSYYLISDIFISSSFIEGLSNSYLEAMAFGLPLVSTMTAGTDELLKDGVNGVVVRGFTEEDVYQALNKIKNKNLSLLSDEARKTVLDFDIKETVKKYEALFEETYKN